MDNWVSCSSPSCRLIHADVSYVVGCIITGMNGYSNGIIPTLRVYDATVRYVNQGEPGALAIYLEPWHDGIFDLRKSRGKEEACARNPFYMLWIPDLRVISAKRVRRTGAGHCSARMRCWPWLTSIMPRDFMGSMRRRVGRGGLHLRRSCGNYVGGADRDWGSVHGLQGRCQW